MLTGHEHVEWIRWRSKAAVGKTRSCLVEMLFGASGGEFRGDDSTLQVGFGYSVKPLEFRI